MTYLAVRETVSMKFAPITINQKRKRQNVCSLNLLFFQRYTSLTVRVSMLIAL